ncbi:MAG: molybdopterin-guanine dinucleotide biosynthesis protein B [Thaumarchaeota archaeon]|nr:molybdopterin-guanine dinucleotide biosynthesis protein B [Nitrososphaerota archaeon]
MKIISITGSSNSGKTTTTVYLIKKLSEDGFKVGAVKHIHHEFTMDTQGKDTWRMTRSGAKMVSSISPAEVATLRKPVGAKKDLAAVLKLYRDEKIDVVVAEGFATILSKRRNILKIVTAKTIEEFEDRVKTTAPPILAATGVFANNPTREKSSVPIINFEKNSEQLYAIVKKHLTRPS